MTSEETQSNQNREYRMFSAFFFGDKEDYLYFCTQSHLEVVYMRGVYHESGASRSFLACCVYSSNPLSFLPQLTIVNVR